MQHSHDIPLLLAVRSQRLYAPPLDVVTGWPHGQWGPLFHNAQMLISTPPRVQGMPGTKDQT